jgi:hypothetical protein
MRSLLLTFTAALFGLVPAAAWGQAYGDPNSLVTYWYQTYLGRAPDPGAATWINDLNAGLPPDQVLASILGSDEFYARAGSNPQGYITMLYEDILKRPPTPSELSFWVSQMYTEDRTTVAEQILTQNPGVWVGSGEVITPSVTPTPSVVVPPPVTATPPIVVTPGIEHAHHAHWERERYANWNWQHGIHEYRRPEVLVHHGDEHHEHGHEEHHH